MRKLLVFTILFLWSSSKLLKEMKQKKVSAKETKQSPKDKKQAVTPPARKLFYYLDSEKKKSEKKSTRELKGKQQNSKPLEDQKLHLNKSFVVSADKMKKLRQLKQNQVPEKITEKKTNDRRLNLRKLQGDNTKAVDGKDEKRLESTPLLLIGNYEIVVEKIDD